MSLACLVSNIAVLLALRYIFHLFNAIYICCGVVSAVTTVVYSIGLKSVLSFLTLTTEVNGPFRNLDFKFDFLFIIILVLWLKDIVDLSLFFITKTDITIQALVISPLTMYLYLNPLYSNLGGSTILAEALINSPGLVTFRLNPLYRWNVLTQHTFVLSDI
jgi:hypothetical protein